MIKKESSENDLREQKIGIKESKRQDFLRIDMLSPMARLHLATSLMSCSLVFYSAERLDIDY